MPEREGVFAGDDPLALLRAWLAEATKTEVNDPIAATLGTVDETGMPNARIVLVKEIEADSLVFYTNYQSVKATELEQAGKAAMVFHWKSLGRQIRVRGAVERVSAEQSDAYYASRPLDSRLGAWASAQSQPLVDRDRLVQDVETARTTHGGTPARPPHWGGYRVRPLEMEFWANGAFRLHDRYRWTRADLATPWGVMRLYP